jgi:peptidoglycan-associated lipoprotein
MVMCMKKVLWSVLVVALVISSGLTGCKKKPKAGSGAGGAGYDEFGGVLGPVDGAGYGSLTNPDDLATVASQFQAVYFDYDSSQIADAERSKLEAVAEYLRANPNIGLITEGHTDERGSNEYNLGLGERRSQAARSYLIGLGIAADRIRTVSYGEEQAAAFGHDEASWQQNRRVSFSLYQ